VLSKCCDLENELRGLLKVFGVRLPMRVGHGGFDAPVREQLQTHPTPVRTLLPLLDARTMLYETFLKLDNAVKAQVRHDPVCQRLMTVPGIGPVTSLTFKAAVDEPCRFRSSRRVAAHFGLTPRRRFVVLPPAVALAANYQPHAQIAPSPFRHECRCTGVHVGT